MSYGSRFFSGNLDNTNALELNNKIDYSKNKLKDRLEVVNNILDSTTFYEEYFDNHYKFNPNARQCLSEDINVCKSLERIANYLLNSKEIKEEEDREKIKYIFYTDRSYFERLLARENSLSSIMGIDCPEHEEAVIHFLKRDDRNFIKEKAQIITEKDLKAENEMGEVLRAYDDFLQHINIALKEKDSRYNRFYLTKQKNLITNDMLYVKDSYLGVFETSPKTFKTNPQYDLDIFDFTNKTHLKGCSYKQNSGRPIFAKGLIYFDTVKLDPNRDFSFVLLDLQNTINEAGLTIKEKDILSLLRKGYSQVDISEKFNITQAYISQTINGIVNKIKKVGNKYDLEPEE